MLTVNVDDDPSDEEDVAWWRGTYAPELPRVPAPGVRLPAQVVVLRRLPIIPNLSWLPNRDGDEE